MILRITLYEILFSMLNASLSTFHTPLCITSRIVFSYDRGSRIHKHPQLQLISLKFEWISANVAINLFYTDLRIDVDLHLRHSSFQYLCIIWSCVSKQISYDTFSINRNRLYISSIDELLTYENRIEEVSLLMSSRYSQTWFN